MLKNSFVITLLLICLAIFITGCSDNSFTDSLPAKQIDLNRYLGTWHEIARIPNWFEKDLQKVTATYTLKDTGRIEVKNQGMLKSSNEQKTAIGEAWVDGDNKIGRLRVSFFFLVSAPYVVFELAPDYSYALVGSGKDFLWILSRLPQMDSETYKYLLSKASSAGYDVSKLEKIEQ